MSYSTRTLFGDLIKFLKPVTLCDIGCMDASDALFWKNKFKDLKVIAFEANPDNYQNILETKKMPENFSLYNLAVSDQVKTIDFYTFKSTKNNKGSGSTMIRDGDEITNKVSVKTIRLDDFLLNNNNNNIYKIALWVDVEGAAYQVFAGMEKIKDKISHIHVELENSPIYNNQKTRMEVKKLLHNFGFKEISHRLHTNNSVGDSVFINKKLLSLKIKILIYFSKIKSYFTTIYLRIRK